MDLTWVIPVLVVLCLICIWAPLLLGQPTRRLERTVLPKRQRNER
jgi:hypothetical protein